MEKVFTPTRKLESSDELGNSTVKPDSINDDIARETPPTELIVTEKKWESVLEIEDNSDVYSGFSDMDDPSK